MLYAACRMLYNSAMGLFKSFRSAITLTFFLIMLLVSVFAFGVIYFRVEEAQLESLNAHLKTTASIGASFFNGDEVLAVTTAKDCKKNPRYQELVTELEHIRQGSPLFFDAYLMKRTPDSKQLVFVANADQTDSVVECGEVYDGGDTGKVMKAFGGPASSGRVERDRWGAWLSGYAPVLNAKGEAVAIFGIDMAERTIQELRRTFVWRFSFATLFILLLSFALGFASSKWLVHPIRQIVQGMEVVSRGDLDHKLKSLPLDEFNRIVNIFNTTTQNLKDTMKRFAETVKENERVRRELEIAAEIQSRALPASPPVAEGLDIAAKSLPAKEVGGDYFDFLCLGPRRTGFVVADASGKGLPGTLFMTRVRSIFRVLATHDAEPALALAEANQFISQDAASSQGMFITFFYAVFNSASKEWTYANAGHQPLIYWEKKTGKVRTFKASGIPLGILPGQKYKGDSLKFHSGDYLVIFSDGVTEAANSRREFFGLPRLIEIVEKSSKLSAKELLLEIETAAKDFMGGETLSDDLTLMVIRAV